MFAYQPEPPRLAGGRVPLSPLSTEPTADTELINTGEMENATAELTAVQQQQQPTERVW